MQNNPHFHSHNSNGLNSPFHHSPSLDDAFLASPQRAPAKAAADHSDLGEPDDFYRPYAERRTSQPDIILQTADDDGMATPSKRRQANTTGGAASKTRPPFSASGSAVRGAIRSVSQPVNLTAAKSTPALTAAAKIKQGTIKERLKQFDTSRDHSPEPPARLGGAPRTPSAQRYSNGTNHSNGRGLRTPNGNDTPSSKSKSKSKDGQSSRRPLFGEVLDTRPGAEDAGFGITRADADILLSSKVLTEGGMRDLRNARHRATHQRAHSDASTMPGAFPGDFESASSTASPVSAPASPYREVPEHKHSSRIPIRKGPGDPTKVDRFHPRDETLRAFEDNKLATLAARRYSPTRRADPIHSLSAVVRAPAPKTSPALRSTRARLPVTFNHTSSSRSKVADRHEKLLSSAGARSAKPKPSVPGQVNIAERRARLQTQLQGGSAALKSVRLDRERPSERQRRAPSYSEYAPEAMPAEPKIVVDELERKGYVPTKEVPPPVPPLVLPVLQTSQPQLQRQFIRLERTKTTSDLDETPILSRDGQDLLTPAVQPQVSQRERRASEPLHSDSLLHQVRSLRNSSPSAVSRTEIPDDFLSQADEGETIQILLGETPRLPEHNWKSSEIEHELESSSEAFHTPPEEDSEEFNGYMFDGRSSIYPDDSVSMVGMRRYADAMKAEPVPPLPVNGLQQHAQRQNFTVNSDARSEINRVLDHYQDGHVTPGIANGFQKQAESLTPNLEQYDVWEALEATKGDPRDLLSDEKPQNEPAAVSTCSKAVKPLVPTPKDLYEDDEEEEEAGGIAIIYGPSEPYNRNSTDARVDAIGTLHSHSASNSTLRPSRSVEARSESSYFDDDPLFRPEPPPKDARTEGRHVEWPVRPSLPEITTTGSGLGLSITPSRSASPASRSPHPPRPVYAPPPPPTPIKETPLSFTQQNSSSSSLEQQQNSIAYAKRVATDIFGPPVGPSAPPGLESPGLPETPASRGRSQRIEVMETEELNAEGKSQSSSANQSLDLARVPSQPQSRDDRNSTSQVRSSTPALDIPPGVDLGGIDKKLNDRRNRLKELVDTEHSYLQDMIVLVDIWLETFPPTRLHEKQILFGNLDKIRAFASLFLEAVKAGAHPVYKIAKENRWNYKRGSFGTSNSGTTENSAVVPMTLEERIKQDGQTTIGRSFIDHMAMLEHVYGTYMKGHSAANALLMKLQKEPDIANWLKICRVGASDMTNAWSLDSMLIKPTQRFLKYPLLLQEILMCTSQNHPDFIAVVQAYDMIKKAADRINDRNKRAELFAQAMSKHLNAEGKIKVGKLLNRRNDKLKQPVGLSNLPEDQAYNSIAQKFGGHFFQIQVVMRDYESYTDEVSKCVGQFRLFMACLMGTMSTRGDWPEQESKWHRFAQALQEIERYLLTAHVGEVRAKVIDPIYTLWKMHEEPQKNMIRRKKLLQEFLKHKAMVEKGETPDQALKEEAAMFGAVNETLIDELPRVYTLTKVLIDTTLAKFVFICRRWNHAWMKKLGEFVDDKERIEGMKIGDALNFIASNYVADVAPIEAEFASYRLCNGAALADALKILSPATTFSKPDDDSSHRRPSAPGSKRTLSLNSEEPSMPNRSSANMGLSPLVGSFAMPDAVQQSGNGRIRASSALSSRGPSTPQSMIIHAGPAAHANQRTYSSSERSGELSPRGFQHSLEPISPRRPGHDTSHLFPEHNISGATTPDERYSGIFHSALPMSDSLPSTPAAVHLDGDAKILFLAASLFEFHIDSTRKEGGYPYLTYQPGEVFDVVGTKGELWLAKNQDDPSCTVGWIWEKHFARILPEQY
ncbi:rho guanyl nucleotide exchange factor [Venturia nashicola]|uniref:Rho guanyl nucleotide exchange factor n=1 Tax=Venturia nashicola TaxID=86259 RepID=A0A4Z1PFE9_9PEZI|nr:rho guanyl nucleotide exchange factor [Venturia nashicola]TLD39079.1 rho guanyl nucleotide exchange factor [Venturia nashicola]